MTTNDPDRKGDGYQPQHVTTTEPQRFTPLQMAQNAAANVLRIADYQEADPVRAYVARAGQQGHASAALAGQMALVSIAESLDRIAAVLAPRDQP